MSILSTATKKRMYELAEEILSEERQNREAEAKGYTRNSNSLCRLYDDADHEFRASRVKSLLDELNNVHQLADSYRQRIAELEARTLTVKLPKTMYAEFDDDDFCREVAVLDKQKVIDALAAAGITLVVGE